MSFSTYKKYKDSGVDWLAEIPQHWSLDRIKQSTLSCKNGIWGDESQGDENDILCVRVADFDRQRLRVEFNQPTIRNVTYKERDGRVLSAGDLLLEKSGGGELQPVGCVVLYDDPQPAVCSNFVARVQLAQGMSSAFWLYFHAAAYAIRLNTKSIKQTSGIQNLDQQQYFDERAAFPPFDEQSAIAAFLDRETSKINELVREQRRLIELLTEKRQAVISHAVTKGLNPHVPLKLSGVEWLGEIPHHWMTPPVFARYHAVLGKMLDEKQQTGTHPVCYLRNADVNWDRVNISELPVFDIKPDEVERFSLRRGDILICEGGAGIGQTAIWNGELVLCTFQKALHRLRPWSENEDPRFFYYCMRNAVETGVVLAGGTATIPHLTGEQLRRYRFPTPPIKEQKQIVEFLDSETAKLDALNFEAVQAIELLQERRTALISAAVTGKIDVRGLAQTGTA